MRTADTAGRKTARRTGRSAKGDALPHHARGIDIDDGRRRLLDQRREGKLHLAATAGGTRPVDAFVGALRLRPGFGAGQVAKRAGKASGSRRPGRSRRAIDDAGQSGERDRRPASGSRAAIMNGSHFRNHERRSRPAMHLSGRTAHSWRPLHPKALHRTIPGNDRSPGRNAKGARLLRSFAMRTTDLRRFVLGFPLRPRRGRGRLRPWRRRRGRRIR